MTNEVTAKLLPPCVDTDELEVSVTMKVKHARAICYILGPHSNHSMADHLEKMDAHDGAAYLRAAHDSLLFYIYSPLDDILEQAGIEDN